MKKLTPILILALAVCLLTGCCLDHEWEDATCSRAQTCAKCGKIHGEPLPHTWVGATCGVPETCSVCGAVQGEIPDHVWAEATCAAPKTCTVCGLTEGETLAHTPQGTGQIVSRWVEDRQANAPVQERTCAVCGGAAWNFSLKDLHLGQWTCVRTEYKGKPQDLVPGEMYIDLREDGQILLVSKGVSLYDKWEIDGWVKAENASAAAQVKGDVFWNRRIVVTREDNTSYEIILMGENLDTAEIYFGERVYFLTRGRTISQQEQTLMEVLPGDWNYLGGIGEGNHADSKDLCLRFTADGKCVTVEEVDGKPVEKYYGLWQYIRSYTDPETGREHIAFTVNTRSLAYQPFVLYYTEEAQLDGAVPPGWCLMNAFGTSAEYFGKTAGHG